MVPDEASSSQKMKMIALLFLSCIVLITLSALTFSDDVPSLTQTVTRTETTDTICEPVIETITTCKQDCLDWGINLSSPHIEEPACIGGYGTVCRDSVKTSQKCSKTIYGGAVNYDNGTSIVPINTTITASSYLNYNYKMDSAPYKTYFRNNSNTDEPVRFEKDGYFFVYDISQGEMLWAVQNGFPSRTDTLGSGASSNSLDTAVKMNGNEAVYAGAFYNTNVTYKVFNTMLKETFILSGLPSFKDYNYLQYSGNIKFNRSLQICSESQCFIPSGTLDDFETSGKIYFKDMSNKTIFYLKEPVITDANGSTTLGIYKVHGSDAQMNFWLRINKTFLQNAAYPVEIDPTMQLDTPDSEILDDAMVFSGDPDSNYVTNTNFRVGSFSNYPYGDLIKFNLSYFIGKSVDITSSSFSLYDMGNPYLNSTQFFNISIFEVYNIPNYNISGEEWTEETVTWDNRPYEDTQINLTPVTTVKVNGSIAYRDMIIFNITLLIDKWVSQNLNNATIYFNHTAEGNINPVGNQYLAFSTKEVTVTQKPYLNISYIYTSNTNISNCTVLDSPNIVYYLDSDITNSATSYCMDITANNVTLDCQGHTIDGNDAADYGIRINTVGNATIKNCTVTDWDTSGLYLYKGSNTIQDISLNSKGPYSLHIDRSGGNVFSNVVMNLQNGSHMYYDVLYQGSLCNNQFINVNGTGNKPFLFFNSSVNLQNWDNNFSQMILCNADYSVINNMTYHSNSLNELELIYTDYTNITNSIFYNLSWLLLTYSTNNKLTDISSYSNEVGGIYIDGGSNSNIFTNLNTYLNNKTDEGFGVLVSNNVLNANVFNNLTSHSNYKGFDGSKTSIQLYNSNIYNNNYGIYASLYAPLYSNLFYNNFFNNTVNIRPNINTSTNSNYWNTSKQLGTRIYSSGPYIGGNYWATPNGTGFSETCVDADVDGFCDATYNVTSAYNYDYLAYSNDYAVLTTSLSTPLNNYYSNTNTVNFVCEATSTVYLTNISLYHNKTVWSQNNTVNITAQTTNTTTFPTIMPDGNYIWNCLSYDNASNSDWADSNYTLIVDTIYPNASYVPPTLTYNNRRLNNSETINISYYDINPQTCIFEWNGANETFTNITATNFWETKATTDGNNYTFRAFCNDSAGNMNVTTLVNFRENAKPTVASATINDSAPDTNAVLKCNNGSTVDSDSDTITLQYQWYNNSIAKGIDSQILMPSNTSDDDVWMCSITPWDGYENGTIQYSSTVIINSVYTSPIVNETSATTAISGINSTSANPTNNNSWVNFSVVVHDADAGETYYVYMCNTTSLVSCKSGNYYCNGTLNAIGTFSCRYNMTSLTGTTYTYYPQVEDSNLLSSGSSVSNTFTVNYPPLAANLTSPNSGIFTNVNYSLVNYNSSDPDGDTLNYSIYGGTDTSDLNLLYNGSSNSFNWTLLNESIHYWEAWSYDQHGYYSLSNSSIFNFTVDTIYPIINLTSPSNPYSTTSNPINVIPNITDTNLDSCQYSVLYKDTGSTQKANTSFACSSNISINLTVYGGGYLFYIFSNDSATNLAMYMLNITVSSPSPPGGGGGGPNYVTVEKDTEQADLTSSDIGELCGNGICESSIGESPWDCPEDCFQKMWDFDQIFCTPFPDCGNWQTSWFVNSMSFIVVGGTIFIMQRAKKIGVKI